MSRRFQFSLRALLGIMLAVALACSVWVNLTLGAIVSNGVALLVVLSWLFDWAMLSISSRDEPVPRPRFTRPLLVTMLVVGTSAATCKAEDQPAAKRRSPTQISASITESAVQDRLKLSAEQRQKIAELAKERDAKWAEIRGQQTKDRAIFDRYYVEIPDQFEKSVRDELSPEQQKQWSRLKLAASVWAFGPAPRVLDEEMQDELKLTDSQAAAVDELQKEFCRECERIMDATGQAEPTPGMSWGDVFLIKVQEAQATFNNRRDTLLKKVLTRPQYDRWREIEWQKAADANGAAVLLDKSVIEHLALSDSQRREIQAIADETKRQVESEQRKGRVWEAMKMRGADLPKALARLTVPQRQRWAALLGKPYRDLWTQLKNSPSPSADEKKPPGE